MAGLLLDAVLDWARAERGAGRMLLEVHESNARAVAFYRRRGFRATGRTTPCPPAPGGREPEMVLPL
ncbi:hypothetical protein GCM10009716_22710 [Streptomyces sodiiphilus]|uniref:N-acetyltransferase domain-containing protein n=1 Tax=Streptomyces sodiiphilus TaxID=226217 RepID=A0ABP5AHS7_9ACTN